MEILELVFMTSMSIVCVCGAIFALGFTVWFLKELIKDFFNNEVKKMDIFITILASCLVAICISFTAFAVVFVVSGIKDMLKD